MAIITIGLDPDGTAYLLGAQLGRWGFTQGCVEIEKEWQKWRSGTVWIEEVNFSNAYRAVIRQRSAVPLVGIAAVGDKVQRIQSTLHPPAFNQRILFPHPAGSYAVPDMEREWKLFPGSPLMDGMDALEMVYRGAMHRVGPRDLRTRGGTIPTMTAIQRDFGRG